MNEDVRFGKEILPPMFWVGYYPGNRRMEWTLWGWGLGQWIAKETIILCVVPCWEGKIEVCCTIPVEVRHCKNNSE